jgi:hypothetical protein
MRSPQNNEHPSVGLGGSGSEKSIVIPPAYSIKYLIITVLLSISPLICALYYQHTKLNKQEKIYIELLEKLNNKENLTKQDIEIVKQITKKPDVELPKQKKTKSNKSRPSFNNRF